MGRPTDSPKTIMFRVRIDQPTEDKIKYSAEQLHISMSEVVRKGIDTVYDALKK